jgi:hypothetical protein
MGKPLSLSRRGIGRYIDVTTPWVAGCLVFLRNWLVD